MGKKLLCGGLLMLAPLWLGADTPPRDPPLFTVRTQFFEIVSPDGASGDFTGRLCGRLVEATKPWLGLPTGFSNRILVRLQPPPGYRYEDPFRVRIGIAGNVEVTVRWDGASELESLERAIARGLFFRLALWNRVPEEDMTMPRWLEAASQRSIRARGNPSYVDGMVRRMREQGPLPLREVLYRDAGEPRDERFADNAYWLLRHLEHHSRRSDQLHNLVLRLLRGSDPEESLMATFGSEIEEFERAHLWWAVGVHDRIQRRAVTQSHFFDSQQTLRSLYRFSYRKDGREVRLNIEELWDYRNERSVRSEVVRRIERINYEMRAIHPFHFNAVLSLGQVMVALMEDDEEAFRRRIETFWNDYGDARRLFEETEEALDRLEEELDAG